LDTGKNAGLKGSPSDRRDRFEEHHKHRTGESMSIINKPPETVKREYGLQEPVAQAVEKYAIFIQSTPDHVVNSLLKMVICKDAEFRRWRKQRPIASEHQQGTAPGKAAKA
jgi:hypothetical protein